MQAAIRLFFWACYKMTYQRSRKWFPLNPRWGFLSCQPYRWRLQTPGSRHLKLAARVPASPQSTPLCYEHFTRNTSKRHHKQINYLFFILYQECLVQGCSKWSHLRPPELFLRTIREWIRTKLQLLNQKLLRKMLDATQSYNLFQAFWFLSIFMVNVATSTHCII